MTATRQSIEYPDLRGLLPHRHPILLVDRVVGLDPGHQIEAVKAISGSEPCYAGLPETATADAFRYPPALLLESLVQAAGLLWLMDSAATRSGTLVLAEVRNAVFHGPVMPGDTLSHQVTVTSASSAVAVLAGRTDVSGSPVLTVDRLVLSRVPD